MLANRNDRRSRHPILSIAVLACLLALSAPAQAGRAVEEGATMTAKEATAQLAQARAALKNRKATTEELAGALDSLADVHARIGGSDGEKAAFRRKAEAQLLNGLALFQPRKKKSPDNLRAEVNVKAAHLIAGLAGTLDEKEARRLSAGIREIVENKIRKRKPETWDQDGLNATYDALASLGDRRTLEWMLKEHQHTKNREMAFLVAAHRAMVKFRDVPGSLRHEICSRFITVYGPTELQARRMSNAPADASAKRLWDQIREYTIPLVQHFAGKPQNAKGEALSTMAEFGTWWREHKSSKQAPWTD